jgi:hypothetical protein
MSPLLRQGPMAVSSRVPPAVRSTAEMAIPSRLPALGPPLPLESALAALRFRGVHAVPAVLRTLGRVS